MADSEISILVSLKDEATKGLQSLEGSFKGISAGAFDFGNAAVGACADAVTSFASTADALDQLHDKTGFSAESLSTLKYALETNGSSLDSFSDDIQKMASNINSPTDEVIANFNSIGLSIDDLKAMSPEQQFNAIGLAVGKIDDPINKAALATNLLGKSGEDMLPVFSKGQAGLDAMAASAQKAGVMMSGDTMKSGEELQKGIQDLQQSFQGIVVTIGTALAPAITPLVDGFTQLVQALPMKEIGDLIAKLLPPLIDLLLSVVKALPIDSVIAFVESALNPLLAVLPELVDAFKPILSTLGDILKVIPIKEFGVNP